MDMSLSGSLPKIVQSTSKEAGGADRGYREAKVFSSHP